MPAEVFDHAPGFGPLRLAKEAGCEVILEGNEPRGLA
jgi:hypothetical protein